LTFCELLFERFRDFGEKSHLCLDSDPDSIYQRRFLFDFLVVCPESSADLSDFMSGSAIR
jgi:hypothetical protein